MCWLYVEGSTGRVGLVNMRKTWFCVGCISQATLAKWALWGVAEKLTMCFCTSGPCICPSLPDHQDSISSTKRYFDSLIACTNIFAQLSGFHVFFGAGSIHSQLIGDNMMVLLNLWSWKDENECRPEKSQKRPTNHWTLLKILRNLKIEVGNKIDPCWKLSKDGN